MNIITTVKEIKAWFSQNQPGTAINDRHIPTFLGEHSDDDFVSVEFKELFYPTVYLSTLFDNEDSWNEEQWQDIIFQILSGLAVIQSFYLDFSHFQLRPDLTLISLDPNNRPLVKIGHFDKVEINGKPSRDFWLFCQIMIEKHKFLERDNINEETKDVIKYGFENKEAKTIDI
jgi:hypothetical protein